MMRCTRSVLMRIKWPFKIARPHIVYAKLFLLWPPLGAELPQGGRAPGTPRKMDGRFWNCQKFPLPRKWTAKSRVSATRTGAGGFFYTYLCDMCMGRCRVWMHFMTGPLWLFYNGYFLSEKMSIRDVCGCFKVADFCDGFVFYGFF